MSQDLTDFIKKNAAIALAEKIQENSDLLTELDLIIGDGDHGINMRRGVKALQEFDLGDKTLSFSEALHRFGMTLVMNIGGASGPLYGSLFIGMGTTPISDPITMGDLAKMVANGVDAVKKRGKSTAGEKTMLDVLVPVAETLQEISKKKTASAAELLIFIQETAEHGVESTRPMLATKGRASFLKERSIGHLDPGAKSSQILIQTVCELIGTYLGISLRKEPQDNRALSNSETIFHGKSPSAGYAIGILDIVTISPQMIPSSGSREMEQKRLQSAIQKAKNELNTLIETADELGKQILSVQIELLEDPELTDPIFMEIIKGASAMDAWNHVIDQFINRIKKEKGYFSNRANDFTDLKNRVCLSLHSSRPQIVRPDIPNAIYTADDLVPSNFIATDWSNYCGIALKHGSPTNHVSMLAVAQGIPLLTNLDFDLSRLNTGEPAIIDTTRGKLILRPNAETVERFRARMTDHQKQIEIQNRYLTKPAQTLDGGVIRVYVNINDLDNLLRINPAHCDGIGLTRTELLFPTLEKLTDEETHYQSYLQLMKWACDKPVTIRTLDAGGDKPIPDLTPKGESNPFLGLRGIRLSLRNPGVFRMQLRAIARAAAKGPIRILLPMVTVPREIEDTRSLLLEEIQMLHEHGLEASLPPIGMMVELAAAALVIKDFQVDFLAIGSNDLTQYVTGTSREDANVSGLYDPCNPAVLKLIRKVVDYGRQSEKEVCICGDASSDSRFLSALLKIGIQSISVAPTMIGKIKTHIAQYPPD